MAVHIRVRSVFDLCYVDRRSCQRQHQPPSVQATRGAMATRSLLVVSCIISLAWASHACSTSAGSGCCFELGGCSSSNDCLTTVSNYFVALGLNQVPNDAVSTCQNSNCLLHTPSTACSAIDSLQTACDDGSYCVNAFNAKTSAGNGTTGAT